MEKTSLWKRLLHARACQGGFSSSVLLLNKACCTLIHVMICYYELPFLYFWSFVSAGLLAFAPIPIWFSLCFRRSFLCSSYSCFSEQISENLNLAATVSQIKWKCIICDVQIVYLISFKLVEHLKKNKTEMCGGKCDFLIHCIFFNTAVIALQHFRQ